MIAGFPRIEPRTSATAARNAASVATSFELWISTISVSGSACGKACCRILSALWDWPTFASFVSICFVPTTMPSANETITNASQPKTAVFQCPALQRPIRPATFMAFCIWTDARSAGVLCRSIGPS